MIVLVEQSAAQWNAVPEIAEKSVSNLFYRVTFTFSFSLVIQLF